MIKGILHYYHLNRKQGRTRRLSFLRALYLWDFWHWQEQMKLCLDKRVPRETYHGGKRTPNDFVKYQKRLTDSYLRWERRLRK